MDLNPILRYSFTPTLQFYPPLTFSEQSLIRWF
jgi:hypothetical protein